MKLAKSETLMLISSRSASEIVVAEAAAEETESGGEEQLRGQIAAEQQRELVRAAQRRQRVAHLGPPAPHAAEIARRSGVTSADHERHDAPCRATIQTRMLVPPERRAQVERDASTRRTAGAATTSTTWTTVLAKVSIAPEAIAVGGRHPLPLEEADVDRHAREARRQREVHVARRELHRVDGPVGQLDRHRAERGEGLREARQLGDHEAQRDPAPGGVLDGRRASSVQSTSAAALMTTDVPRTRAGRPG